MEERELSEEKEEREETMGNQPIVMGGAAEPSTGHGPWQRGKREREKVEK